MSKRQTYTIPIYALFLLSGATALAYQVVWIRMLVRTFGATSFAISTVLAAFMAGLALGSYLFGRLIDRKGNPILIYGFLELGIGVFALLFPLVLSAWHPLFRGLYVNLEGRFYLLSLIRFALSFSILLIPTTLMGGTLPILSRYVSRSLSTLTRRVGLLYSINTFGAVAGTFVTGFVLLPTLGMKMTVYTAVSANVAIFIISMLLARGYVPGAPAKERKEEEAAPRRATISERIVLVAFLFTGLAALSAEVIWSRVLTLVVGTTVYAFTIMLTAFLLGLALGSAVFSRVAQRTSRPRTVFAVLVLAIGFVVFGTIVVFGKLPMLYLDLYRSMDPTWLKLISLQFLLSLGLMIVPTFLMGGTFPLVARIYAVDLSKVGARIGTAYAFNTVGSICGSFIGSFVLLQVLGVEKGMITVAMVYLAVGLILFLTISERLRAKARLAGSVAILAAAVLMIAFSPGWDRKLMTSGVYVYADAYTDFEGLMARLDLRDILFYDEGPGATVSTERAGNVITMRIDGKADASSAEDMITQELIAHLPLLFHDRPDTVLVVGLGSGVTLGSALTYDVKHLECVELLENVVEASRFFDEYTYDALSDPRVDLMIGDGRNHVRLSGKKYDVIISQPTNPWISGVGDLFTVEYFTEAREHLKPGGIMIAWLALYHMGDREVRSTLKSFQSIFPNATLWFSNEADIILMASLSPLGFDERLIERMRRPRTRADLERVGIDGVSDILSALLMDSETLRAFAGEADILHTDDNMLLEFHAARETVRPTYVDHLARFVKVLRPGHFEGFSDETNETIKSQVRGKQITMMATVQHHGGNSVEAAELYRAAYARSKTDPYVSSKYGELQVGLADARLEAGDWDSAIEAYTKALGKLERHRRWVPHDGLGSCYIKKGMYEEAREELMKATELNPYDASAHYNLGFVRSVLGDTLGAIEAYERSLELDPDDFDAANNLAWYYAVRGENLDRAVELGTRAVGLKSTANHYDTLGWAYFMRGDMDNAKMYLGRALEMEPQRVESIYHLALAHLKSGEREEGIRLLRSVVQLDRGGYFASEAGGVLDGIGEE